MLMPHGTKGDKVEEMVVPRKFAPNHVKRSPIGNPYTTWFVTCRLSELHEDKNGGVAPEKYVGL